MYCARSLGQTSWVRCPLLLCFYILWNMKFSAADRWMAMAMDGGKKYGCAILLAKAQYIITIWHGKQFFPCAYIYTLVDPWRLGSYRSDTKFKIKNAATSALFSAEYYYYFFFLKTQNSNGTNAYSTLYVGHLSCPICWDRILQGWVRKQNHPTQSPKTQCENKNKWYLPYSIDNNSNFTLDRHCQCILPFTITARAGNTTTSIPSSKVQIMIHAASIRPGITKKKNACISRLHPN